MKFSGEKVVEIYEKIQQKRPIIHCITNAVTVNDCANILLAAGASPTMAHHPCEVEEITAGTAALICNFGAISDYEAMETAGKRAHALGHPIVIDPVGVSGSSYRRKKCLELMKIIHPTCIRGNYSEIQALLHNCGTLSVVGSGTDHGIYQGAVSNGKGDDFCTFHGNHHCKKSALYPVTQLRKGGTERIPELSGNTDHPHRIFPDQSAHKGAWTDVSFQAGAATVGGKFQ